MYYILNLTTQSALSKGCWVPILNDSRAFDFYPTTEHAMPTFEAMIPQCPDHDLRISNIVDFILNLHIWSRTPKPSQESSYDLALVEGSQAFLRGDALTDNPYKIDDIKAIGWTNGWMGESGLDSCF